MAELTIQELMGKRPSTRDEFVKACNSTTEETKTQAQLLYDQHKKYLGVGEIDMPISSMGIPCMHGLLST
jgi:hypothetical protein